MRQVTHEVFFRKKLPLTAADVNCRADKSKNSEVKETKNDQTPKEILENILNVRDGIQITIIIMNISIIIITINIVIYYNTHRVSQKYPLIF